MFLTIDKRKKEEIPMIDFWLLLEFLKLLFLGFEIVRYFINRKREKTLLEEVENCKQRLNTLENVEKSKKLDT
jgi:hypothetical protein